MGVQKLGHAGLQGWKEKAADRAASAVGKRTPLDEDWIRAAFGFLFLALAVRYLVNFARDAAA